MPNPLEVATITVGGQMYQTWKTITTEQSFNNGGSTGEFSIIEIASPPPDGGDPSAAAAGSGGAPAPVAGITVGSPATITLGGTLVLTGVVEMVQRAYNAEQHGVLVRVVSTTILAVKSSVRTSPGQFQNYTLSGLINSIVTPTGSSFSYGPNGAPPNSEKPFPRVSLNVGESVFTAISRFARMRNIYLRDDANGNFVGVRVTGSESSVAQLTEGQYPLKSATAVLSNRDALEQYQSQGQVPSSNQVNGRQAGAISATGGYSGEPGTYKNVTMPMPGDSTDAAMHTQSVIAHDATKSVEVTVVVQGWFSDGVNLWTALIGQMITVVSPLLFPNDQQMSLYIRSVIHRQDSGVGTETEMVLCNAFALGGEAPIGAGGTPGGNPVTPTPDPPDAPAPTPTPSQFSPGPVGAAGG